MLNILAIERYYRDELLIERLDALDSEIAVQAATLFRFEDGPEQDHLNAASRALRLVVTSLREAQVEARAHCQERILEEQLTASLELVGRSPERMRRQNDEFEHCDECAKYPCRCGEEGYESDHGDKVWPY